MNKRFNELARIVAEWADHSSQLALAAEVFGLTGAPPSEVMDAMARARVAANYTVDGFRYASQVMARDRVNEFMGSEVFPRRET